MNEHATPLIDADANPASGHRIAEQPEFGTVLRREPAAACNELPATPVLLMHEEDLSPEINLDSLAPKVTVSGLIAINTSATRSHKSVASLSRTFVAQAFEDAVARIKSRYGLSEQTVVRFDEPPLLAALLTRGGLFADQPLLVPAVPVGPCRDALSPVLSALAAQGTQLSRLPCAWDDHAWPHATRGFFSFKEHIPRLLDSV